MRILWFVIFGCLLCFAGCDDPESHSTEKPNSSPLLTTVQTLRSGSTVRQVCRLACYRFKLHRSQVRPDTSMAGLNCDETDFLEFAVMLESHFEIEFPPETLQEIQATKNWEEGKSNITMAKLADLVDKLRVSASSTLDQVCHITAELMGVERSQVQDQSSLADLGANDLDFVELVMELEEHFEIAITDDVAEGLMESDDWQQGMKNVTMQKLTDTVDQLRSMQPPPGEESSPEAAEEAQPRAQ